MIMIMHKNSHSEEVINEMTEPIKSGPDCPCDNRASKQVPEPDTDAGERLSSQIAEEEVPSTESSR